MATTPSATIVTEVTLKCQLGPGVAGWVSRQGSNGSGAVRFQAEETVIRPQAIVDAGRHQASRHG